MALKAPPPEVVGMNFHDFETPAALVDRARVRRNLKTVIDYCAQHGFGWRPHVKTHKSTLFAQMQLDAGAKGLTVATPREAEVMSRVSDDLLLAHPPVGSKLMRILGLPEGVRIRVALDSAELVSEIGRAAHAAGRPLGILVELDVGMGRVGVTTPEAAVALATQIAEQEGVHFEGVLFYPGHIRVPGWAQADALQASASRLGRVLDALYAAGVPPAMVSGGSTPTLFQSHHFPGLTEIRPGTAIFHDRESAGLGVAELDDVAYTVVASVVSLGVPGQAVIDAGSKALSKEVYRGPGMARSGDLRLSGKMTRTHELASTHELAQSAGPTDSVKSPFTEGGYGVVLDHPEVRVREVSEEHGILELKHTAWRPQIGERVRIVPNHVCVSVNLQDAIWSWPEGADPSAEAEGPPRLGRWPLERIELEGRGREPDPA